MLFQKLFHFFISAIFRKGHSVNGLGKLRVQFFFSDAAECLVLIVHADVFRLVKPTEHADLRKLGNARQEHKAQIGICALENGIERLKYLSVLFHKFSIFFQHIQQWFVIFVNEHHHLLSALLNSSLYNPFEARCRIKIRPWRHPVCFFPLGKITLKFGTKCIRHCVVNAVEIEVKNRMPVPIFF